MAQADSKPTATRGAPRSESSDKDIKTAVVVVHGMGEQRPMSTLWELVEALWIQDPNHCEDEFEVYSKPDKVGGSFELRRITTRRSLHDNKLRVDFFELYWAHQMQGNTVAAVFASVKRLLVRRSSTVPDRLHSVWVAGWIVMVLAVALSIVLPMGLEKVLKTIGLELPGGWLGVVGVGFFALLNLVFGQALKSWVGPVAGDAARYLSPDPPNIAARQAIRRQAVDLLEALHTDDYDRIIVVGHSLGTVVAYDALCFAFGQIAHKDLVEAHRDPATARALDDLEELARKLASDGGATPGNRTLYRDAQRVYLAQLAKARRGRTKKPLWLVSDFISTGSPLSKADVLLAHNPERFARRIKRRDTPVSPPFLEKPPRDLSKKEKGLFRFSHPYHGVRGPHHAAVFAPTVWTNLYFVTEKVALGDVIAGPVAPLFGPGVLDVRMDRDGKAFRHLDYWTTHGPNNPPPAWVRSLRKAVNFRRLDERTLWGAQVDAAEVDSNAV